MKKNIIVLVLTLSFVLSLVGCGSSETNSSENTSNAEAEDTLEKTEYIKLAKEAGYRAYMNIYYLSYWKLYEFQYTTKYNTISEATLTYATSIMEQNGITESFVSSQKYNVSQAHDSLKNAPDDEEAKQWHDIVVPLCEADNSYFLAVFTGFDDYDNVMDFINDVDEKTDNASELQDTFLDFVKANPVAGTESFANYCFSYPEEWWTKTSDDNKYFYIYPEEDTSEGMIMLFYEEMNTGSEVTNVVNAASSIKNSDSVIDVESDTGVYVSEYSADEIIYTQEVNNTEYTTDCYVIANRDKGVLCVSLIVPKYSTADYNDGFNEVIDSLVYIGN